MGNLVIFYDKNNDVITLVNNYKKEYQANVYQIETENKYGFFDKLSNDKSKVKLKRCNLDLKRYSNIILITNLWHDQVPAPVLRFLEQQTGNINNIIYILYNKNKEDKPSEFEKMDKILNLRRDKSYFVTLDKKNINVRVYQ